MSIIYLQHHEINKHEWDQLIEQSPQRQVYALSWYLDTVAPGWGALAETDEASRYTTVMPLPWQKKLGFKYLKQPFFCQQLGIYAAQATIPLSTYATFLAHVEEYFPYAINYACNTANCFSPINGYTLSTHYLDLSKPYEQLYSHYTRDRKMNLKRAQKANLSIEESKDIEPLITFFRTETANNIYGGVSEEAYALLRRLFSELHKRGLGKLYYTLDGAGSKNAGALFIVWGGRIIYIFNAAPANGRKQNGRTLLLDYMIRRYASQDYTFDFESPGASEPDIMHFYKSFGSTEVPYPVLTYNHLPKALQLIQRTRIKLARLLCR